jgi:predicted acyltransferase (DUF342 family)
LDPKLDEKLEAEEAVEEAPKPKAKGKPKAVPEKAKLTEEEVRIAANSLIKSAIKAIGDQDKGVKEGKAQVKRVLGEFDAATIAELKEQDYEMAIRAFERVAGTFVPAAEESDDLDI